jgi:hypothetical protein
MLRNFVRWRGLMGGAFNENRASAIITSARVDILNGPSL